MMIRTLLLKIQQQNNHQYIPLTTTTTTTINNNNNNNYQQQQHQYQQYNRFKIPIIITIVLTNLITYWLSKSDNTIHLQELPTEQHPNRCEPFQVAGYLNYDPNSTLNNQWIPFDTQCPPISILKPLINDLQKFSFDPHHKPSSFALPWLVNRTVVLIGDSIERFHARDFCDILSSSTQPPFHGISENGFSPSMSNQSTPSYSFFVDNSFPNLKPPPYLFDPTDPNALPTDWPSDQRQLYLDHHLEWAHRDNIRTSPWVCEVPSYGFRIVTLFAFGLEPYKSGAYYADQDWFITPSKFVDKIHHTLIPLLQNLARERGSSKITEPDLIEVSSGLWDLRQWSEEDGREMGIQLDDSSEQVYQPLSNARLEWYSQRLRELLTTVHSVFPNPTTPILWRSLHHPRRHSVAPYSRVEQLDQFAAHLIRQIQSDPHSTNSSLASRIHIDSWGRKMLGFENHFRDPVHPKAIPGSVLWSDMMLWELRNAVAKSSNTPT